MAEHALTPADAPKTYADLRRAVEETLLKGQRAIELAKVRSYHDTGWFINAHILLHDDRAEYGAKVYERLAKDLGIDKRLLYLCAQFARLIPIVIGRSQLAWAHYRALLRIPDDAQRKALALQADKEHWTSDALAERVAALNASLPAGNANAAAGNPPAVDLLTPQRGTPGVHRVARLGGNLVVDLGFATYLDLTEEQAAAVREGDLVSLDGNGRPAPAGGATKADLFNYRVELLKVVDGDTLWVKIYLRPRQWVKQKLRLRGLDCPELSTPEGKTAKRFVDALLAKTTAITISTTKPDKYDRYLADVFLELEPGSISQLSTLNSQPAAAPLFLNNELLTHGQAVRKDAWEFGDWEPELLK